MADDEPLASVARVQLGRARIHQVDLYAAARAVSQLAQAAAGALVVTPNIAHIVRLEHDNQFARAYEQAALIVPDGWPVARALGLVGGRAQRRVNGTDLVLQVAREASEQGLTVACVGGHGDAARHCAAVLERENPGLHIVLTDPAPPGFDRDPQYVKQLLAKIAETRPDVLLLGLGAPKQELFVVRHRPAAGVVLAIGSSLELIAGVRRRAPAMWRRFGFEWLYRLLQEPRRLLPRYVSDPPRFIIIVLRQFLRRRRGLIDRP